MTPPDHEHFPFDLSPNILDLKYKPYTNPLFDFKEQWSSQDFSDGNRFFSKGVEKEKADKAYPPANEHSSTNNPKDFERTGKPNSSIDRVDEKGRIITRRWYDGNGRAKKDVDFTDHGNPKTHPEVPHEYPAGTKIRSDKYPEIDGQHLQGKQILEIPASNQTFEKIDEYKAIANRYKVEIRFREE